MKLKIVIVDYGMGNLNSVYKKLVRLQANVSVSSQISDIQSADKIILPGVGHFNMAMENIKALNLFDVLNEEVLERKKHILGICLGMQLMAERSEEGNGTGFGWVPGDVVRFKVSDTLVYKIPHMGWNQINIMKASKLMDGIEDKSAFYFVHSYYMKASNEADILNQTEYDIKFTSAIEKNNIFGVQYHPEKSHDVGELLLKNFIEL